MSHNPIIQAMIEHILENHAQITAHSSGQLIIDYSKCQVAFRVIPKPTIKQISQGERIKL